MMEIILYSGRSYGKSIKKEKVLVPLNCEVEVSTMNQIEQLSKDWETSNGAVIDDLVKFYQEQCESGIVDFNVVRDFQKHGPKPCPFKYVKTDKDTNNKKLKCLNYNQLAIIGSL